MINVVSITQFHIQLEKKEKQNSSSKRRNNYSFTFTLKSVKSITKKQENDQSCLKKIHLTLRTEAEPLREERQDVSERKKKYTVQETTITTITKPF